jgi:hypothetical protein
MALVQDNRVAVEISGVNDAHERKGEKKKGRKEKGNIRF